jgi:hypothetical protein
VRTIDLSIATPIEQAPGVRVDTIAAGSATVSHGAARSAVESMLRPIDASGYPARTRDAA